LLLRVREPGHPPGTPVFEGRPDGRAAAEPPAAVDLLERSYDAVLVGRAVVIGRAADVVEVRRADGSTAARLWLDHRSGLTLRRDVLDPSGAAVRTSRFVELTIAATAPPAAAPSGPVVSRTAPSLPVPSPPAGFAPGSAPPLRAAYPARWSPPFGPAAIARLRRAGWPIPAALPHGLVLTSARRTVGDGPPALHLRYTDGLATVSLFTERGSLDASRLGTWQAAEVGGRRVRVRPGLPQQVVWAGPGVVYTMVADAPTLTVAAVVAALPAARPTGGGVFGRLARGLDRMASWLNPLR
jgi:sigma-E factor negative regulatory protein RseB